jgi:hypothetical protein
MPLARVLGQSFVAHADHADGRGGRLCRNAIPPRALSLPDTRPSKSPGERTAKEGA